MIVKELIRLLSEMPDDARVMVWGGEHGPDDPYCVVQDSRFRLTWDPDDIELIDPVVISSVVIS